MEPKAYQTTKRLALWGLYHHILNGGRSWSGYTERNAAEVVRRSILHSLAQELAAWEDGAGAEPDWRNLVTEVPTDGEHYTGPSHGWIDFAPDDAALVGEVARAEVAAVLAQVEMIENALPRRS